MYTNTVYNYIKNLCLYGGGGSHVQKNMEWFIFTVYLCVLMSEQFQWPVGTFSYLHKRKLMLRKCQQLMKSSRVQQGQAVTLKTHFYLCCCPFLWSREFPFKIKHAHFIVSDNLWRLGWLAKVFHFSRITSSHQQLNLEQSEPDKKMKPKHESVFYVSFTARLTCCLLICSSVSPLPSFYCLQKLQRQSLLKPLYSGDLKSQQAGGHTGRVLELSCCVNLCIFFGQTSIVLNN